MWEGVSMRIVTNVVLFLSLGIHGCSGTSSSQTSDGGPDSGTVATASFERPISLVFKVHLEPQSGSDAYKKRRDDVEAVHALAKKYGLLLSIHGNGEFWQYARELGDEAVVRGWLAEGYSIGPHMHSVYEERDGEHSWRSAQPSQMTDATFVEELWKDHERELKALLPDITITEATPYNCDDTTYATQMNQHGYSASGGGREEIAEPWIGHHPFHPWRIGASNLEENLASPTVLVTHYAQFGEADKHGPNGTFADQSLAHHKVGFLLIYLNWLNAERSGDSNDKVWMYGFLTHDTKSRTDVVASLEEWIKWLTENFGNGKKSVRGNTILKPSTIRGVYDDYVAWEREHPNTSSFNVPTPTLSGDANSITSEQRKAIYPEAFWGLSELLRADVDNVANYTRAVSDFASQGVSCHEIEYGSRADSAKRAKRWLLWKESDGSATVNLATVTGGAELRYWNVRDKSSTNVSASAVTIGSEPVVVDLGSL